MKTKNSKLPYVAFALRIITYLAGLFIAALIYLEFKKMATTFSMEILAFIFIIISVIIIFIDLYFQIKQLKEFIKTKKL
ncbi:hypothetical protein [Anaerovorax odorimutans]|uniref:hypothetical protein n=1 Tax=Anaerovorax odorimutans TaxID=109327 RepID=UPI0004104589|nr:hypothetical protein [Anaerovorax odorimutans]